MECSRIPPVDQWDKASVQQLDEYRRHIQFCQACRRRCISVRPDELLFELRDSSLPEDFWIGFWDSLEKKLPQEQSAKRQRLFFPIARWAAVFVAACLLFIFHKDLSESPSSKRGEPEARPFVLQTSGTTYPIIDDVKNPRATYYIFQPSEDENIVMMFDPDLDL